MWSACVDLFEWFDKLRCFLCDPNDLNRYRILLFDGTYITFSQLYCELLYTPRNSNQSHDKM
eukprot:UN09425